MTPAQVVIRIEFGINPNASVSSSLELPRMFMSNNYLIANAFGGVVVGGNTGIYSHKVRIDVAMQGGVLIGGHARLLYGGHMYVTGKGGVVISSPVLSVAYTKAYVSSSGIKVGGTAKMTTFSPVIKGQIAATIPPIKVAISTVNNNTATITTRLPKLGVKIFGGKFVVAVNLTKIVPSIIAYSGTTASLNANLPAMRSAVSAIAGYTAKTEARLTLINSSISAKTGYTATVNAQVPVISTDITAVSGVSGGIATSLPAILAKIEAGFGAVGTVSAKLTHITSAITVLAQATKQELLLVLGTRTNAVSTYTNYPYNSFCELDGVYYGAGPNGLSQIDANTGLDDITKIDAGLSTGLMQFGEPHLKRITDAYMTLRTAGDLTLTVTVDEGTPVILTMPAQQLVSLIQRRVIIPKGLHGKSWKFEINNVDGADFDFGHLGFNVAVSARRIGR